MNKNCTQDVCFLATAGVRGFISDNVSAEVRNLVLDSVMFSIVHNYGQINFFVASEVDLSL